MILFLVGPNLHSYNGAGIKTQASDQMEMSVEP